MTQEKITFRLTSGTDPEERLEEAALWKAVYDATDGKAIAVTDDSPATFGRLLKHEGQAPLTYWNDPAFLKHARRRFSVHELKGACEEVRKRHDCGMKVLVKSTRNKHVILTCDVGDSLEEVMGDLIYSFIDGGPQLMVQDWVAMEYEWRFFCVNRKIVADSSNHPSLTPLDYPFRWAYKTPQEIKPDQVGGINCSLYPVAQEIAQTMHSPTAVIDCAFINGYPGCVELNELRLGQVGLFACDVRALVKAFIDRS